ncbi:hypothetical protein BV20DRAFT_976027 [Pilatotrama ljubarskyi]|nr:hypothetical protein BV20DRAFT_976027 [Pilatotrama ljubarskyi]
MPSSESPGVDSRADGLHAQASTASQVDAVDVPASKKRAQRGAPVLAKAKYRPDVISERMLYMGRMITENPGILYAEYQNAFKSLSAQEHEQLKKDCAQERKQKRSQSGVASHAKET